METISNLDAMPPFCRCLSRSPNHDDCRLSNCSPAPNWGHLLVLHITRLISSGLPIHSSTSAEDRYPQSSSLRGGGPQGCSIRSVISNFTLPIASLSAIAKKEERVGCPTIDASVSRCWWVSQSYFDKSAWPVPVYRACKCSSWVFAVYLSSEDMRSVLTVVDFGGQR